MSQLGSPPIKYGMYQPKLSKSFDEKGVPHDLKDAEGRFNIFFKELMWYASLLKGSKKV